jgi:aminopeptidase N
MLPPRTNALRSPALLLALAAACTAKDGPAPSPDIPATQDIQTTDLALDLAALSGTATVVVRPAAGAVTLDVAGLTVTRVTVDGEDAALDIVDGTLSVPADADTVSVAVDYTFPARGPAMFDGWMPALGVSFVWPYACSNLFPCNPSLEDGLVFTMSVSGVDEGLTAIYPSSTHGDGPTYMAAVAVGDYTRLDLGSTSAGTALYAWYLPGTNAAARAARGTAHLVAAFDYFEQTYGAYNFGPEAGTIEVDWGSDSWGGMEHHPYFHVGTFDFDDEEAQVHEAGHGWFGDGVRLACWEDFVLSEGTTTYIAARALEQVDGPSEWAYYVDDFLVPICEGTQPNDPTLVNTIVLPDTCNEIDFENDAVWSLTTYMKGACFYEDVGDLIGPDELDLVIAEFYAAHVGTAARMEDMITLLKARAPSHADAIDALVSDWLLSYACPEDYVERCRSHTP